jgi:hypothetical protein
MEKVDVGIFRDVILKRDAVPVVVKEFSDAVPESLEIDLHRFLFQAVDDLVLVFCDKVGYERDGKDQNGCRKQGDFQSQAE